MLRKIILAFIGIVLFMAVALVLLALNEDVVGYAKRTVTAAEGPADAYYRQITDWTERDSNEINLSTFTFMDRDQDGQYSLGDRSLNGIAVELYHEGSFVVSARSNINGFSNFSSELGSRGAHFNQAGNYTFQVVLPEGWINTTENSEQPMRYRRLDGSIGGGVLERMPEPIGLIPEKYIAGFSEANASVQVTSAAGLDLTVTADQTGYFKLPVPSSGEYRILSEGLETSVAVDLFPVHLGALSNAEPFSDSLFLAEFEGLVDTHTYKVPNGYGGLNWFNLNAIDAMRAGGGYVNGALSGTHVNYLSSGHPGEIYLERGFDFHSIAITIAWPEAEGEKITIEMWRGDEKIVEDVLSLSYLNPIIYTPYVQNVTRVRFSTEHHWQALFDDFRYRLK